MLETDQSTLQFTPRQMFIFEHHLDVSGEYSATLPVVHKDYSHTDMQLFIERCTLMQLNEREDLAECSKQQQQECNHDRNLFPGSVKTKRSTSF